MQCTLFLIGGFVSGTFVGALSIAAVARIGAAVADDVLASLIEMRSYCYWLIPKQTLDRADIAIFNATEQPCSRKPH